MMPLPRGIIFILGYNLEHLFFICRKYSRDIHSHFYAPPHTLCTLPSKPTFRPVFMCFLTVDFRSALYYHAYIFKNTHKNANIVDENA